MEKLDETLERIKLTSDIILKQHELMLAMLKVIEFNTRQEGDKHD